MKTALFYLQKKQADKALSLLSDWIAQNQEDAEAYFQRARAYTMLNKLGKTIQDLNKCLALDYNYLVKIKADKTFDNQTLNPFFRRLIYEYEEFNEGVDLMYEGKFTEAIQIFIENEWSVEQNQIKYFFLSIAYYHLGEFEKSLFNSEKFRTIYPILPDIFFNEACVYKAMGELPKAVQAYQNAIQLDDEYLNAYFNLALVFSELERYAEAIENYTKVLEINDLLYIAWFNRAVNFVKIGNTDSAKKDMIQLLKIDPKSYDSMLENEYLVSLAKELRD